MDGIIIEAGVGYFNGASVAERCRFRKVQLERRHVPNPLRVTLRASLAETSISKWWPYRAQWPPFVFILT